MKGSQSSRQPRKTLKVVPDKVFSNLLRLAFEEGGKVPDNLAGLYKSHAKANEAIENYNEGYDRAKITPSKPRKPRAEQKVEPVTEQRGDEHATQRGES